MPNITTNHAITYTNILQRMAITKLMGIISVIKRDRELN